MGNNILLPFILSLLGQGAWALKIWGRKATFKIGDGEVGVADQKGI